MWFDLGFADILIVEFSELKSYRPIFSDNKEPQYCMFLNVQLSFLWVKS
jgi:hypothetical protein